jgi:hypothetical protein
MSLGAFFVSTPLWATSIRAISGGLARKVGMKEQTSFGHEAFFPAVASGALVENPGGRQGGHARGTNQRAKLFRYGKKYFWIVAQKNFTKVATRRAAFSVFCYLELLP